VRLNPCKADLQRWRETFAEKLRGWGVEAEASRRAERTLIRSNEPLWRIKAAEGGRLRHGQSGADKTRRVPAALDAADAWSHIAQALAASAETADQKLAVTVAAFVKGSLALSSVPELARTPNHLHKNWEPRR
jgi:hypothetical protein